MSEEEDTLRLARDKWVPTEIAERMIRAVAPPTVKAGQLPQQILYVGSIGNRKISELTGWAKMEVIERDPTLPTTIYEWNLQSLILRLLALRVAEAWPVSAAIILKLVTIEPDQLPALEMEKLSEMDQIATSSVNSNHAATGSDENANKNESISHSGKAAATDAAGEINNRENTKQGKLHKVRGPRPDALWANVLGWAASWLAANGEPRTQAELEQKIEERFFDLGKEVGETQIATYAEGLLAGYRAHRKSRSRNTD